MNTMTIVGLIVSVIGGVLGGFSIVVTWKLYQAGMQLHLQTVALLSDIKASSRTTEVTSTRFTERLVGALVELLGRDVKSSLVVGRATLAERIDSVLQETLSKADKDVAKRVRDQVQKELSSAFRAMEFQTASIARLPESEAVEGRPGIKSVVTPGLASLVKWILDHETKYTFLSIKFLREKVFGRDTVVQEALQFAIDNGVLETYDQPNPKNPSWPTKACRLKMDHPLVRGILGESDKA
jgi:hypothetical protein